MARTKKKITELTSAQERQLAKFRAEWLGFGLSTEPADRRRAEAAINTMCDEVGESRRPILWFSSPAMCSLAITELTFFLYGDKELRSQLGSQLGSQLDSQLGSQLDSQLRSQLYSQLGSQLGSQLDSQLGSQLDSQLGLTLSYRWWGQLEAAWVAFYSFPEVALGVTYPAECSRRLALWAELVQSCNWWWTCKDFIVVSDRPELVSFDDEGLLHGEEAMACRFRDGWGVHCWHGVRVPPELIETPDRITAEQIGSEENVEVRRVMLERFGTDRYIRESGAKLLDDDPEWGKLWRADVPDDEALVMAEVVNSTPEPDGSFKDYWLRVDPHCRPMFADGSFGQEQDLTTLNAIGSTFGMTGEEYRRSLCAQT